MKIGYGTPFDGKFGELAEDEREDDHRQERLEDRPGDADRRLLVADLDVAPDERAEQLAVVPELADVEVRPAWAGLITVTRPAGCIA